eukprot:gene28848-37855_t
MSVNYEDPFIIPTIEERNNDCTSYASHDEVLQYLKNFADKYSLEKYVKFDSTVIKDSVVVKTDFDAVIVCNGHFSAPFVPHALPGLSGYAGVSMHSIRYDSLKGDPTLLVGKRVLVVGGKSSATDMAREILLSGVAEEVRISDRNLDSSFGIVYPDGTMMSVDSARTSQRDGYYVFHPSIRYITEGSRTITFVDGTSADIDVILWCTGYLYDFPFLPTHSGDECLAEKNQELKGEEGADHTGFGIRLEGGKRLRGLHLKLIHQEEPTMAFIGLPFSVVPFPLFYFQARLLAALYKGEVSLPDMDERRRLLLEEEKELRQRGLFEEKYHYLGGLAQWDYCRTLTELFAPSGRAGSCVSSTTPSSSSSSSSSSSANEDESARLQAYITMLQQIYEDNSARRPAFTGAPDTYRSRRYNIDWSSFKWEMESDFGYYIGPENDDWNPVYKSTLSVSVNINEEIIPVLEKASKKKRKRPIVVDIARRLPKRNDRNQIIVKVSSAEEFYSVILCWTISSLSSDPTPFKYCVHPLSFSTQNDYTNCMLATCFEECRAVLKTALKENNSNFANANLMKISLVTESEIYESSASGIFCIDCQICTVYSGTKVEKYYPSQSKLSLHTIAAIQKSGLICILSVDDKLPMQSVHNKLCILMSYMDTDEKKVKATRDSCKVTLCFHRNPSDEQFHVLSIGSMITVYTCCSLLSYQRMAVACTRSASSPIVQKLISPMKLARHIKFEDTEFDLHGEGNTISEIADETFSGLLRVLESPCEHSGAISDGTSKLLRSLNPSQQVAVSRFLDPAVRASSLGTKIFGHLNLIQGPPGSIQPFHPMMTYAIVPDLQPFNIGCGKTHVLCALLCGLVKVGYRTLVCAPSNKALCVALEKFMIHLEGQVGNVNIVLVGVEERLTACSSEPLVGKTPVVREPSVLEDDDDGLRIQQRPHSSCLSLSTQGKIRKFLCPSRVSHVYISNFSILLYDSFIGIAADIKSWGQTPSKYHDNSSDSIHPLHCEMQAIAEKLKNRVPKFYGDKCKSFFVKVFKFLNCLSLLFKSQFIDSDDESSISTHSGDITLVLSKFSEMIHQKLPVFKSASVEDELISTAQVVFSTACSSANRLLRNNFVEFDVLIVDEAAQLFEPELLVPLQLYPSNLIMIGDPRQLPATIFSPRVQSAGLGISAMQRLMDSFSYPFDLLQIQYRMHPSISYFSNQQFYGGQIIDSESVQHRPGIFSETDSTRKGKANQALPSWLTGNYAFIDVHGTESPVSYMGNSMKNDAEAELISKMVGFIIKVGGLRQTTSVCVITFYAAQVSCIQKHLRKNLNASAAASVKVLTVDSFQGSEADIVVVSFVRSNSASRVGFVRDYQRLNVALTRAKHLLLSVGSRRTLENVGFQQQNRKAGTPLSLSADDAHPLRELVLDSISRNKIFTEEHVLQSLKGLIM